MANGSESSNLTALSGPPSSGKATESFGALTLERSAELASKAVEAAARAEVESGYVMAIRKPRKEEDVRVRIMDTCKNLTFATSARYRKPVGSKQVNGQWEKEYISGPSIRFAEQALRIWGNVLVQQIMIYDDERKRISKVVVRDLESNISYSTEIVVEKTVERKNGKGRNVISERANSYGEKVCICVATEDEVQIKQAALVSKQIRNNGLRMIPDHILQDAMDIVAKTVAGKIGEDPKAAMRKLLDEFATINVLSSDIERMMGCPVERLSVGQLTELQEVLTSIKDGQTTWSDFEKGEAQDKETAKGDLQDFKAGDESTHTHVSKPVGQPQQPSGLTLTNAADAIRMMRNAESVRDISEIMNATINLDMSQEERKNLIEAKNSKMQELEKASSKPQKGR